MTFLVYIEPVRKGATKRKKMIVFPFVMTIFGSYVEPLIDIFILINGRAIKLK